MPGQLQGPTRLAPLTMGTAVDVSRITGLALSYNKREQWHEPDTFPGAVDQGVVPIEHVYLELESLLWYDRLRVALTLASGYYYMDSQTN